MHREKRSGSLSTLELRRDKFVELRSGSLGVRLAETESEKDAARALRYRVFYEEMGAIPNENIRNLKRDFDEYDEFSDYLLVIDYNKISDHERVVGTYRLIRKENADKAGGFYSRAEYDLSVLQEYPGNLLEVGRSCVHPQYRNRSAMQLLWEGIAAYIFYYRIDILFGCQFPGNRPRSICRNLNLSLSNSIGTPSFVSQGFARASCGNVACRSASFGSFSLPIGTSSFN